MPGDIEQVCGFEFFQGFENSLIQRILTGSVSKQFKHREYVYRAGDPAVSFSIVLEGAVKLIRHSPRGEDLIMYFAVQGDIIGALMMNQEGNAVYPISAKSMGTTRVLNMPKSTFRQYWQTDAEIQRKLNAYLYRRMSTIQDDKTMSTSPLRTRIASLLLRHLDQDSDNVNQPLSLILTRQEIADVLGVAVESVIRAMREWQDNGTICRLYERGPEIINIEKLLRNFET